MYGVIHNDLINLGGNVVTNIFSLNQNLLPPQTRWLFDFFSRLFEQTSTVKNEENILFFFKNIAICNLYRERSEMDGVEEKWGGNMTMKEKY